MWFPLPHCWNCLQCECHSRSGCGPRFRILAISFFRVSARQFLIVLSIFQDLLGFPSSLARVFFCFRFRYSNGHEDSLVGAIGLSGSLCRCPWNGSGGCLLLVMKMIFLVWLDFLCRIRTAFVILMTIWPASSFITTLGMTMD
ncbi:hypothetical protein KC19_5G180800 [Ceratodon purpureus]|uniref:Uncharacterized protein n=1 Tax=Ceratodon purpureus TaxID=3225 RepID=A0A8T0I3W0_CERPU|nr:hypothetical protein KC19_N012500 [Ceratodon purpureus]KAG0577776.1 hypothetical protein KC19_5G180800 [Ceratodon purpureus]